MSNALINSNIATMNSREIAELVGSRHDKVKQSIERLAARGVIVQPPLGDEPSFDSMGRPRITEVYVFSGEKGKRDSIVVVAQLSPEFTARLVDRWQELEAKLAKSSFPVPQSFPEALRLAAEVVERNEQLTLKNEQLALENKAMAPKAVVFDNCVALRQESLATFVRTLKGVNTMAIITNHRSHSAASKSTASTTGASTSGLKSFPYRLKVIPPLWWPRMPPTRDSTIPFCFR